MAIYNSAEAKANLSALIEKAERGEEVIIARRGKPVVRLVAEQPAATDRSWFIGCLKGKAWATDDAFDPEPEEFWFPKDDILLK
jgi:prevent-host-death family protein